ncbi:MAG: M67 family metallopeptidase [Anaerolineales bacterium]|nr:M67 family metallopeptidase [Anaerolineales bacterium]
MSINIPAKLLIEIHTSGETAYPEEGAGLMLGYEQNGVRYIQSLLKLENAREDSARHNRYLITAEDMLQGELEADRLGLSIVGIFHSHPDHPNIPSENDREWAIPWYSYLITSIQAGQALESKSWRLADDRSHFDPEKIIINSNI